ncbi:MAG: hypothetical protein KDB28_01785, partial [Tetrasphaera sp.]|nr:hypothetical protein [Tetrasphaera sp.]
MKWWLFVLAFLLGALLTWIYVVRRATREVRILQDVPVREGEAGLAAGAAAGAAGAATIERPESEAVEVDEVEQPSTGADADTVVDLPPAPAAAADLDTPESAAPAGALDLDSEAPALDLDGGVDLDAPS